MHSLNKNIPVAILLPSLLFLCTWAPQRQCAVGLTSVKSLYISQEKTKFILSSTCKLWQKVSLCVALHLLHYFAPIVNPDVTLNFDMGAHIT